MERLESVVARGVRVTYLARGHGPKNVILLHGWGSNPWVYLQFLAVVPEDRYRVLAVDYFGDSDRPWGGYDVSGVADEVRDVMDALGMRTATVGGHSLGGIISQMFALRYLERLDKLILIGTGPTTKHHGTLYDMFSELEAGGTDRAAIKSLIARGYGKLPPPDIFEQYVDHAMKAPTDGLIAAMASGMRYDFIPLLRYMTVPALVVHGIHDTGRKQFHLDAFRNGLPKGQIATFECGHYIMEELPDQFNTRVLNFLAG